MSHTVTNGAALDPNIRQLIDQLFKRDENEFYVHAEPKVEDGQGISRYIGRYIRYSLLLIRVLWLTMERG